MAAVSCVAVLKVVGCSTPFQFTFASLVKFVPFTVSIKSWALQYGLDGANVVDAESEVIAGGVPGAAPIVKWTTLDISVVVVLLMFVPDEADPGICTATFTVPVVARSEAGTGAVSWILLTRVVFSAVPFQRISAPVVKPDPLAVIVKPGPPTSAELGLTKVSTEEDVWMERFVLYCEQAEASPQATNATISHLREHIRIRSSRAILPGRTAD
jgi:hypothetical protein